VDHHPLHAGDVLHQLLDICRHTPAYPLKLGHFSLIKSIWKNIKIFYYTSYAKIIFSSQRKFKKIIKFCPLRPRLWRTVSGGNLRNKRLTSNNFFYFSVTKYNIKLSVKLYYSMVNTHSGNNAKKCHNTNLDFHLQLDALCSSIVTEFFSQNDQCRENSLFKGKVSRKSC
jgi:hypothetical protein